MKEFHRHRAFASFFMGGFECSTHRRTDGERLDLIRMTEHDRLARDDYERLGTVGIRTVRDGLRWHLIETAPNRYDWSSLTPLLAAARAADMQVIWDLCHYGWPDDLDIWSADFITRFARFAGAAARVIGDATNGPAFYCPVNEISFWAWAGGEVGRFNPGCAGRGAALKRQLVRAAIAAMEAIRKIDPNARFISAEPLINVDPGLGDEAHRRWAAIFHEAQYEVFDLLSGRLEPELGGSPEALDIIGLNYYPNNQWYHGGATIPIGHHAYRPLHDLLLEAHRRYGRPLLIAETGAEGCGRAAWLHYVASEVERAIEQGIPVEGICLYPILDYPGWENGRLCRVGLLSAADQAERALFEPLARELRRQQEIMEAALARSRTAKLLEAAE
jgi:beta-glucosidase/6-phospho-beta-glucosidase/beta-galactosidase